jgi:excisionase family DNA binding protein
MSRAASAKRAKATTEPSASVEEVALHLGVRRESVYRWIESRSTPAHRIGRLWKFKVSEIDAWVRAGGAAGDADVEKRAPRRSNAPRRRTDGGL